MDKTGLAGCLVLCSLPWLTGCFGALRLTVAPTVDTTGAVGVDVRVSVTPYYLDVGVGGSYIGSTANGAAQTHVGLSLYGVVDHAGPGQIPFLLRTSVGYSGRFVGRLPECPKQDLLSSTGWNGVFAMFALQPQIYSSDRTSRSERTLFLGPELTAEYLVATGRCDLSNRGMFSLGLSLTYLYEWR